MGGQQGGGGGGNRPHITLGSLSCRFILCASFSATQSALCALQLMTSPAKRQCRICLDSEDQESLIAPCSCSGTQRWVHRACLDEWRAQERVPHAFTQCPTCRFEYVVEARADHRSCRFGCLVLRDTVCIFAAVQCVLAYVGAALHAVDTHGAIKQLYPRGWAERNEALHLSIGPYYASAVILCLALLGLLGLWLKLIGKLPPPLPPARRAAVRLHGPDAGQRGCECSPGFWQGFWQGCCHDCCQGIGEGCARCEAGEGGCSPASLGSEGGSGEGALPVLAVLLFLLALVGLFYAVLFSTVVIQRLAQRHLHLLSMRSETQRVVVQDLAPPELAPAGGGEFQGEVVSQVISRNLGTGTKETLAVRPSSSSRSPSTCSRCESFVSSVLSIVFLAGLGFLLYSSRGSAEPMIDDDDFFLMLGLLLFAMVASFCMCALAACIRLL